jgi:hypothetical protein
VFLTDNGYDESTGMRTCDGHVFVKIYSTQDGEVIASGSFTETSFGNTADQARVSVANKIGQELGDVLSKQIQNYYKKRNMYGSEYLVEIKGNFLPIDRINIRNALAASGKFTTITQRNGDNSKLELSINYNGQEPIGDVIFMQLVNTSTKFNNYDYSVNSNQIIFEPLKGNENL